MPRTYTWQSRRQYRLPPNWPQLRRAVMHRDQHTCQLRYDGCQGHATDVDHIEPGDNHDPNNLQAACRRCHATKSAREGNAAKIPTKRPPEPHPGAVGGG